MVRRGQAIAVAILFVTLPVAAAPLLDLQLVTGNVTNPVYITHAGDGSGRLFIVEQAGRIKIFNGTNLLAPPFLDISPQVLFNSEEGLLSVAFHPGYATNGQFFVYFTQPDGNNQVARFTASPGANIVNTNTMVTVLRILHPTNNNHNGGQMQFGPDGYLYIGTGDGGSGCDPPNNAQTLGTLLGKMLRLDVSNFSTNYTIPLGNPFVAANGALPEIWAYGLRNPWRFSFDRATGDLWIADVGQNLREEVDLQPAGSLGGQNYGWRLYEGFLTNTCAVTFSNVPSVLPIFDYDHSSNRCAIVGGYRYRGTRITPLVGTYLYGDECGGQIYGATTNGGGGWTSTLLTGTVFAVTTFGEDEASELYVSRYGTSGAIYRIVGFDSVGDGIADWWRQQYFGTNTTNSASCATCDPDGDGFNNLQEYTAGTSPTNSLDALRVQSIASSNTDILINFTSVSGRKYRLENTADPATDVWTIVTNNIAGTGGIVPVTDTGAQPQRFYRVRVVP